MPLPVRNFEADLKRIAGTNLPPRQVPLHLVSSPTASYPGAPPTAGAAVASGPTAARVLAVARGLLGTKNRLYFASDPSNACASFVSTVLLRAGATQGREGVVGPGFTTSAAGLTTVTEAAGAVLVSSPLSLTAANVLRAQPGDIVQWFHGPRRIGHSGIAIGGGRVIAIGSGAGRVETYGINYSGNDFTAFQLHRFPR